VSCVRHHIKLCGHAADVEERERLDAVVRDGKKVLWLARALRTAGCCKLGKLSSALDIEDSEFEELLLSWLHPREMTPVAFLALLLDVEM
jgi:hypothetical protein